MSRTIPVSDGKRNDEAIKIKENEEPLFRYSVIEEDLRSLKQQRDEDFRRRRFND